jgi:hypothetical protein
VPTTYYKNYTGEATIAKKELIEMDTLKVHGKGSTANLNEYVVTVFEISVMVESKTAGKKLVSHVFKGNTFSAEAKEILKQAGVGSKVFIENVSAVNSKGKTAKFQGMSITVN